jgi:iron only hydrogenase large subunit-like protein
MSVKIFDTHALQTDVLFDTNNQANNGRRRQKSTAATDVNLLRSCCPSAFANPSRLNHMP